MLKLGGRGGAYWAGAVYSIFYKYNKKEKIDYVRFPLTFKNEIQICFLITEVTERNIKPLFSDAI